MPACPFVFVDVDTQVDFMDPRGALYVPGAEQIVPNLARLFAAAARRRVPVMSSADDHAADDPEFARFPPHCVRGTPGQAKLPQTLLPRRLVINPGDRGVDLAGLFERYQQAIFQKATIDVYANPCAARLVETLDAGEFIVFGVATDFCVLADVRGLLSRGKRVRVVEDAVRGIATDSTRRAWDAMLSGGATRTTTEQVLAMVDGARRTRRGEARLSMK